MPGELRVVATAGHVDHGKSSLIVKLTGIDPDRWAEEKRRGLTIDLGYAWCTLPSGREVGFVDVPGHERFIGNMLAGVGPVPLVLFVVAADEGWKPQSEEHLQILDVLDVHGGVVALTKIDLVDEETQKIALEEVRERVDGTVLGQAPIVPVSAVTGEGLDRLQAELDSMVGLAPAPAETRTRLFVDRAFSIKGAGTVVTGTLQGDCLEVGQEVELLPSGRRARIRSLQTHKRAEDRACPVSRVAANLVGVQKETVERGEVLAEPDQWTPTRTFDAELTTVRSLTHPITARGAFMVHAGAAEVDARLRLFGDGRVEAGGRSFVRVRTARPIVLDVFDRFVLRDVGRRETLGGGIVLDISPPRSAGKERPDELLARREASRRELLDLTVYERGAVRVRDLEYLVGASHPDGPGGWIVAPELRAAVFEMLLERLRLFHEANPLKEGARISDVRGIASDVLRRSGAPTHPELVDSLLQELESEGLVSRTDAAVRLVSHQATMEGHGRELQELLEAIGGAHEASPPTFTELVRQGIDREVIEAAARKGLVIRISPDLVMHPDVVERAKVIVRRAGSDGITVSGLREALGTTRKYAVPLLEHLDRTGATTRTGDLRFARDG